MSDMRKLDQFLREQDEKEQRSQIGENRKLGHTYLQILKWIYQIGPQIGLVQFTIAWTDLYQPIDNWTQAFGLDDFTFGLCDFQRSKRVVPARRGPTTGPSWTIRLWWGSTRIKWPAARPSLRLWMMTIPMIRSRVTKSGPGWAFIMTKWKLGWRISDGWVVNCSTWTSIIRLGRYLDPWMENLTDKLQRKINGIMWWS